MPPSNVKSSQAHKEKKKSKTGSEAQEVEESLSQRDTPRRASVLPSTNAAISSFFGEGKEAEKG